MARSSHAYVRGSTVEFYRWLQSSALRLPAGPSVWICGDCHIGNLGPLADRKGRVSVQIRDLDQTVVGNPVHDIVRLGLSLASAARGSDLPGARTLAILEQLIAGYQAALTGDFEIKGDKSHRSQEIQSLLARSAGRRWRHLAAERLGATAAFPLGRRFLKLDAEEYGAVADLLSQPAVRALLSGWTRSDPAAAFELLNAVYWIKGCSSLGRLRYAALLRVGGPEDRYCLVDIKEAVIAAAPRSADGNMPINSADRVVAGAKALSPNLGDRMSAAELLGKPVVLRELMPQDLKLEINGLSSTEAGRISFYLGNVVGRAHGRQLSSEQRRDWLAELGRHWTSSLDAPSWLFQSVVQLIGTHEAAYLEHCRRQALVQQDRQGNGEVTGMADEAAGAVNKAARKTVGDVGLEVESAARETKGRNGKTVGDPKAEAKHEADKFSHAAHKHL